VSGLARSVRSNLMRGCTSRVPKPCCTSARLRIKESRFTACTRGGSRRHLRLGSRSYRFPATADEQLELAALELFQLRHPRLEARFERTQQFARRRNVELPPELVKQSRVFTAQFVDHRE